VGRSLKLRDRKFGFRGKSCLLLNRIDLPKYVWVCRESPVSANGSRARREDPGYCGFGARRRLMVARRKVSRVHRYSSAITRNKVGRLTEVALHRKDLVPFAPAVRAKWPEHPPVMSGLPVSKEGRSGASDCNSPSPQSTFVDIVHRCVVIQSPDLLLTILVMPSDQSEIIVL
jgi:hypothetical protein